MTLVMKYEKGYCPRPSEVSVRLLPVLASEAIPVKISDITNRTYMGREYHVLGVMNYRGKDYNILLSEKGIARAEVHTSTIFNAMGTDYVDGILPFLEVGRELAPGHSFPIANLAFEPDSERHQFLRRIAQRFKSEMPRLETLALAHQPDGERDWVYEIL